MYTLSKNGSKFNLFFFNFFLFQRNNLCIVRTDKTVNKYVILALHYGVCLCSLCLYVSLYIYMYVVYVCISLIYNPCGVYKCFLSI